MPDPSLPPRMPSANGSFTHRNAATLKLAGILLLVLLLLIPLGMIGSVLAERLGRRNEAVAGITETWGRDQSIIGPVLAVPYRQRHKVWREVSVGGKAEKREVEETRVHTAYFLPSDLAVEGRVKPGRLHRGIYEAVVYRADFKVSGRFEKPDFALLKIEPEDIAWADAVVTLAINDLRGTGEALRLSWGKEEFVFVPGSRLPGWASGLHARIGGRGAEGGVPFHFTLDFNGSGTLQFAPMGRQNVVKIASEWADPSFRGAFSPAERRITPKGFDATWKVSWYGRNFPQQWTDTNPSGFDAGAVNASLFGVQLMPSLDSYRTVERSIKYGALFLALAFAAFFLFEVRAKLRIHVVQYLLVGGALCLFYLLLLSLSEFISFPRAYLVASGASTLLVALYCAAVLCGGRRARKIAAMLAATYAYLYIALRLQDYSLLFGSAGLFLALAAVMYLTRRVDWSSGDEKKPVVPPAPKGLRPRPPTVDV